MKKIENLLHKIANRKTILLAVVSLYFSAFSVQASSELTTIDTAYLNSLTGAKVTWEEVASAGKDTIAIGDKFYKYTYHMPDDYEPSTRLDDNLTVENTTNKVFIGEYIDINSNSDAEGGAIYNTSASTEAIHSDFVDNYVNSSSGAAQGGAIYNYSGTIGDITGEFIGNYTYSNSNYENSNSMGGAIYNYGTIGDITGDFINNYSKHSSSDQAQGGAIANVISAKINNISGSFIKNYAMAENNAAAGGVINNFGEIDSIIGDFIGNYAYSKNGFSVGGAISNDRSASNSGKGKINNITGTFRDNYAYSENSGAYGGAIYNNGDIRNIIGNFSGNYAYSETSSACGGAIDNNNERIISDIIGDFISNYVYSNSENREISYGGAINNNGTIGDITGDFINNYSKNTGSGQAQGGAIANGKSAKINNISSNFISNYAYSENNSAIGGAINNFGEIDSIIGDFIGNYAYSENGGAYGGAVNSSKTASNSGKGKINNITGIFRDNYAYSENGGAYGGAIRSNYGSITLVNSSFYDNYVKGRYVDGGAIGSSGTLNIIANDGKNSAFKGNKRIYKDEAGNYIEESNAIYMNGGILNLSAVENGQIIFDDKITTSTGITNTAASPIEANNYNYAAMSEKEKFFVAAGSSEENYIETYLDRVVAYSVSSGMNASWEKQDNKYIFIEKTGDETQYEYRRAEFSYFEELNGYVGDAYQGQAIIFPSDLYGGDLQTLVDMLRAEAEAGGAEFSYEYKDGVYYFSASVNGQTASMTIKEDTKSGGALLTQEAPIIEKETEIISLKNYNGNIEAYFTDRRFDFVKKDGNYYAVDWYPDATGMLIKIDSSLKGYTDDNGNYINQEQIEQIIAQAKEDGKSVATSNSQVIIYDRKIYGGESGYFYQDENGEVEFYNYLDNSVEFNITGDGTGKVVFNDDIEHEGTINVSNTEVEVNAKGFDRANLGDGAIVSVGADKVVKETIINSGALLKIKDGTKALINMIASGGKMLVESGGEADDTVVFSGGTLATEVQAKLNNLLAQGGAILDLDAGTVLTGNIVIDSAANMGGEYDYSKIFKDEVTDAGSLTLVGGLNDKLKADSLVNNTADKKLNLTDGNYLLGNSASVAGWDKLTISDATVKLDGAIKMADAQKPINLTSTSELNLAGNSPLVTTIIGSLNNDGILNFHHDSDDADDITNIYGNYKAYDNAKMYIDVNTQTNKSDQMLVDGDVSGSTKVTIYKKGSCEASELIKFVDAPN
ncbi:MAG: hypothetical protein E7018_05750, partial [Alphaproteobacteria bacterium]|nr:hypothetical protein [Alphaproteobacteria bacterium]